MRLFSLLLFLLAVLPGRLTAFQVVASFDAYAAGLLTADSGGAWQAYPTVSQPMVEEGSPVGNRHAVFGRSIAGGPFVSMWRVLPRAARIPATGLSTTYFRIRPRGARIDDSAGLADGLSAEPAFADFHAQVVFANAAVNGATQFKIAARSGGSTFDVLTSAPKNAWYDVWIVTDRVRGMYDVWYSADGQHPVLLANDYVFRTASSEELSTILVVCNGQNTDNLSVDLDDFHTRPGRADLSRPARTGIQPAPLRVATFNTKNGTGTSLTTLRESYLNGEQVICLQEVQQSNWTAIQNVFPNHPHRLLTVKQATASFFKTECVAVVSSLPILESDAKMIKIDPQVDQWERWAQYVRVDLGGGRSARIFHFHNTYNFDANNFESEKSGMVKFRDWILQKTGAVSLASVPDLVVLGDFNLTSAADVIAIMPMPLVRSDGREYLMANPAGKASTTLWTNPTISDHNGLAASLNLPVLHDRYEKWASAAITEAELRGGLGTKTADPDGDGLANFGEYALNQHPWRVQSGAAQAEGGDIRFRRGAGRLDVRYATLRDWSDGGIAPNGGAMVPAPPIALTESPVESGEATEIVFQRDPTKPARFFRLKATEVP